MSSPYKVVQPPEPPALPGGVVLRETFDDLLDALCADIGLQASACVREFGDFQFLISPTPLAERLLTRLMIDPNYRELPWAKTRVWIADDAPVEPGSACPGHSSIGEMLGHAGLPREQIHGFAFPAEGGSDAPAAYEAVIRETLGWREKGQDRPDFALLDLGKGGRIAGLEPEDRAQDRDDQLAVRCGSGRLSVTTRLLNATRFIAVLAIGEEVGPELRSIADSSSPERPAVLNPIGGELRWYLDHASCGSPEGGTP